MTINTTGDGNYAINGTISTGTSGAANGAADGTVVIAGGNYSGNNAFEQLIAGATTDGVVTINGGANVTVDAAINNNFPLFDDMGMPTGTYGYNYQNVVAGDIAGSSGIINVSGSDTILTATGNSGGVRIGHEGDGELNVTNGAVVNTFFLEGGRETGSVGTINIDGPGSAINMSGTSSGASFPLYSGEAAFGRIGREDGSKGYLNITNGGSLSLTNEDGVTDVPAFQIARNDGSYGRAIIDGAGSLLSINQVGINGDSYAPFPSLTVGRGGEGILQVRNDGRVEITGDNTGIDIGRGGEDGVRDEQSRLEINSGGVVNLTSQGNDVGTFVNIGRNAEGNGLVSVEGVGSELNVTTNNSSVDANVSAFITVGRDGLGILSITNGGTVNITGGPNDNFPGMNIGRNETGNGTVTISGVGSSLNITGSNDDTGGGSGFVTVGRAGSGELIVSNRGQFINNSTDSAMFIGRETTAEGLVEVTGLGSLVDGGELVIVGADFDFSANDDSAIDFVNGGQGRITVVDRGIFRGDEIYLGNGGAITGDGTIDGNVTLNGDDSTMTTAELGPGTGANPGAGLLITGDLTMTYGVLNLELFGTTPANNDLISVSGIANLNGGSVDISFRDGFTAAAGDSFSLVFASDLNFDATNVGAGVFDGVAGQALLLADTGNELVLTALNNNGTEDGILNFNAGAAIGVDLSINDDDSLTDENGMPQDPTYGYGAGAGAGIDSFAFNNVSEILGTNQNDTLDASGTVNGVRLTGRSGNDIITGGGGLDTLDGNLGNDLLIGGGRADVLNGGGGDDILRGGSGVDVINGGTGNDTNDFSDINAAVIASLVTDTAEYASVFETFTSIENLIGGNGNDTLTGDGGVNSISGSNGNDTINGGNGADILSGDDGIDTINGGNQGDTIDGGIGNDMLFGDQGADTINGGEGDDTIDGGSSSGDVLNGEAGNDIILGGQGNDTIDGGTGVDTVDYSGFGGNVTVNLNNNGNPQTAGGGGVDVITNVENIIAGDFADRLTGRGGDTQINGGAGGDVIFGLGGEDMLFGEGANDFIQGGNGNDVIDGGTGQDQLNGGNGNDTILGGDGNELDRLTGAADDDILDGGGGRDILRGDSFNTSTGMNVTGGNDIFDFNELSDSVAGGLRDIIRDFVQGEDMIDVSDIDAITGGMDDAFTFIGRDSFSGTAGELRFQDAGRNVVVSADVDGDGTADLQIQLNGNFDLEARDFIL